MNATKTNIIKNLKKAKDKDHEITVLANLFLQLLEIAEDEYKDKDATVPSDTFDDIMRELVEEGFNVNKETIVVINKARKYLFRHFNTRLSGRIEELRMFHGESYIFDNIKETSSDYTFWGMRKSIGKYPYKKYILYKGKFDKFSS
jgi:O-methyltransferase involved in polyketide biosynthesis